MNPMNNEHQMNVNGKEDQEQMTTIMSLAENVYMKCSVCTIDTGATSEISYTVINVDKKREQNWFKILYGYLFNFYPLCVCTRGFFPVWVLKCLLTLLARENVESHWLHLFDFSPLCIFKCLLKSLT